MRNLRQVVNLSRPSLETSIGSVGFTSVSLEPVWNVNAEKPALSSTLIQVQPELKTIIAEIATAQPIPATVMPFATPPFYRPAGSHRCFYYAPSTTTTKTDITQGDTVLAIKGLEPCIGNFEALLRDLRRACYSPYSIAEHLVFEERKIPGCLGLGEAIREAERALAIQCAHLDRYGSLAHLPVPLFVFRHSDEVVAKTREGLQQILMPAAFESIKSMLGSGLGVYVYFYPGSTIRVRDLDYLMPGLGFRERLLTLLQDVCDPEEVIHRWVEGFVRFLHLGFVPGSLSSLRTGICCQPQNACIDGGFVDLDSLTPIEDFGDTALQAALKFSTDSLIQTVRTLVAGGSDPTRADTSEVRIDLHHLGDYVFALLRAELLTQSRPGYSLDPRVVQYFTPAESFADLVDRLRTYYTPSSEFGPAARDVSSFVCDLLRASRRN